MKRFSVAWSARAGSLTGEEYVQMCRSRHNVHCSRRAMTFDVKSSYRSLAFTSPIPRMLILAVVTSVGQRIDVIPVATATFCVEPEV